MTYYVFKLAISSVLVVIISEVARRSSLMGAILASIPLISVLALVWLYIDTQDVEQVSKLASSVFWLVLPSLVFFISLPLLLQQGVHFYLSLGVSTVLTIFSYFMMIYILGYLGIKL